MTPPLATFRNILGWWEGGGRATGSAPGDCFDLGWELEGQGSARGTAGGEITRSGAGLARAAGWAP